MKITALNNLIWIDDLKFKKYNSLINILICAIRSVFYEDIDLTNHLQKQFKEDL